ncbi:glycosyltransferase [Nguyenibacter vanlangensis]|uniref:Glycosyltransferase n=1 Tax=Nguyenibacter vanlangensis TaxID=1216886 RepID=A0ABZ3D881_9PROT
MAFQNVTKKMRHIKENILKATNDKPRSNLSNADALRDEGKFEEAAELYKIHLKNNEDRYDIMVQIGNCLKDIGNYSEALTYYRKALSIKGDDSDIYLQIGHLSKLSNNKMSMFSNYLKSNELSNQNAYQELMQCIPNSVSEWAIIDQSNLDKPRPHWIPQDPSIRISAPIELLEKKVKESSVQTLSISAKIRRGRNNPKVDKNYQLWKTNTFFSSFSDAWEVYATMSGLCGKRPDKISNEITVYGLGLIPSEQIVQAKEVYARGEILDAYRRRQMECCESFIVKESDVGSVSDKIKISILLPVYKGPPVYVERAIVSVLSQTYGNIELCIVDDFSCSDELKSIIDYYGFYDSRVKFCFHDKNRGIAEATNTALRMATGSYIALLDHDDLLAQRAIEKIVVAIRENEAVDWIYTDECKIDENNVADELFTKPDWSPSLLKAIMYTGHLSAYRKSLVEKVGGFRSKFDFSQDYDLALRISDFSPVVCHIPECLYGWRMIQGSAAIGGKPLARLTNISALQDSYDRRGIPGRAIGLRFSNRMVKSKIRSTSLISIIIPSDNPKYIEESISSIAFLTTYEKYEIIVVCNSDCKKVCESRISGIDILYLEYNKAYNFSEKCNVGADVASGEYFIFYNDDVRITDPEWLDVMLEAINEPGVGIVGPKLLYENGAIQHAGMVTGVRGFVGTAFHTFLNFTPAHFGFAQCLRDVSLICGACLMIGKDVFQRIGGFDAVNTPISHSDVDICFKVRELGLSCVYTPYTELTHFGHLSIGAKKERKHKKDKSDIFLLKRWWKYISYDPFFPPSMRDILYIDSPSPISLFLSNKKNKTYKGKDILLVSHDLTGSGAPKVLYDIAQTLTREGHYVLVLSPSDGVFRKPLQDASIDIIIDPLCIEAHDSFINLAKNFDFVLCNTIVTWEIPKKLKGLTKVYLYSHESDLIRHFAETKPEFVGSLQSASGLLAAGPLTARKLTQLTGVVPYILPGCAEPKKSQLRLNSFEVVISVVGTYEPRKGQDLAIAAYACLPEEYKAVVKLKFAGRTNDRHFRSKIEKISKNYSNITLFDHLSHEDVQDFLSSSDIVLVPSRDDPLPLVSMEALSLGKILICADTVGTSHYIEDGVSGFIVSPLSPEGIRDVLVKVIKNRSKWAEISSKGKMVYNKYFTPDVFRSNIKKFINEQESA